jgi:glucose-1-phosphate cytidylyltransferase
MPGRMAAPDIKTVVILCGGRGTRLQEHTQAIPKPLVEIGGRPIVWHVLNIYLEQGFTRAILCCGYKGEMIAEFAAAEDWPEGVSIEAVDTGLDTPTGGRVHAIRDRIGEEETFGVTYADGLADIDLSELERHHAGHDDLATVTVVRPELQFGVALLDHEDRVEGFREKPRAEHWINGGFFCFEPGVFQYLTESSVLEREPLEGLAADSHLRAYRHTGFWECMDTYKDAVLLNDLWASGAPPWVRGNAES